MSEKTYGPGIGSGPVYLGIDQSYTGFGLTFLTSGEEYQTYVYKAKHSGVRRLEDIDMWLQTKIEAIDVAPHIVDAAIESPVLRTPNALNAGMLYGLVLLRLYESLWSDSKARFPLQVAPNTLKKYVSGSGAAKKNEMLLHAYKRWGVEFDDDNACDSYGLARIAAKLRTNRADDDVLRTLQNPKYRDA